ncbi:MAG: mannitol dehydrogenase [Bacillota bacterium]
MKTIKTAVQIGAGNIGRGFMGQIFGDSGYRIVFIDVNQALVDEINARGQYRIELVDNQGVTCKTIRRVSAVSGKETEKAAEAIAGADIMAISVGVAALEKIAPLLTAGFRRRWRDGNFHPLNILVCENLLDAPVYVKKLLQADLSPEEHEFLDRTVGLVETSIGRMVPGGNLGSGEDMLAIKVEPYCSLPVDREGFIGGAPGLKYLESFSPFRYYIQRKLFVHNAGHAVLAYGGWCLGKKYIWEAVEDDNLRHICLSMLREVAAALEAEHGVDREITMEHVRDLLRRFANKALGDTVERVGRDTRRKLGPEDRLIGAFRLLKRHHLNTQAVPLVVAAALYFAPRGDEGSRCVRDLLLRRGLAPVLEEVCGLNPAEKEELLPAVTGLYKALGGNPAGVFTDMRGKL